jgi:hypothetical protein
MGIEVIGIVSTKETKVITAFDVIVAHAVPFE